jgi:hypothetical protein
MATAIRQSPGVYLVNGKRINAPTAEAAMAAFNKTARPGTGGPGEVNKPPRPVVAPPLLRPNTQINTPSGAVEAGRTVEEAEAQRNITVNNPNFYTPTGSQTTTIDPVTGQPTVNVGLSAGQQRIQGGIEGTSGAALDAAFSGLKNNNFTTGVNPTTQAFGVNPVAPTTTGGAFNPQLTNRTLTGQLDADRSRIEDSVFNRLTKNVNRDFDREKETTEQTLLNRGIPLDPGNPLYKRTMDELNERKNQTLESARGQAVEMGGNELQRSYGIGEGMRSNDFSQQLGTSGQNLNIQGQQFNQGLSSQGQNFNQNLSQQGQAFNQAMGSQQQALQGTMGLANLGAGGFMPPTMQGFQGAQMEYTDPTAYALAMQQLREQRRANRAGERLQGAALRNRGGGTPAVPTPPNPFNPGLPPGM